MFNKKNKLFKQINQLRFIKKTKYVGWDKYKAKIDFLDEFYWKQKIRKQNISS